jgi:hypothetical protein
LVVSDGVLRRVEGALAVATCRWDSEVVSGHFKEYEVPVTAMSPLPAVQLLQEQSLSLVCGVEVTVECFKVLVNLPKVSLAFVLAASEEVSVDGSGL